MPWITADGNVVVGDDVSTLTNVLSFIRSIFSAILTTLGSIYTTVTTTPLLMVVVVIGFAGALISIAVSVLHRLGFAGGRGRGRRRARR